MDIEKDIIRGTAFDKKALTDIETEYGIKVPPTFADILLRKSEGRLDNGGVFSFKNPYSPDINDAIFYYLSSLDKESSDSFSEFQKESDYGIPGLFLVGSCAGDWFVCLDYREVKKNPPVVIIVPDQPDGYEEVPLFVSKSFDEFWNNLTPEPCDED